MHRDIELNRPHVKTAKLYIEAGDQWVLHVWTDISSTDNEALDEFSRDLDDLIGRETGYTSIRIYPECAENADRT